MKCIRCKKDKPESHFGFKLIKGKKVTNSTCIVCCERKRSARKEAKKARNERMPDRDKYIPYGQGKCWMDDYFWVICVKGGQ